MGHQQTKSKKETQSQTLLVTGGCGFIGSQFVKQAIDQGYRVIILDALTYAGRKENLEGIASKNYHLKIGDICNEALVLALLEQHAVDAVVHFAAESHVDRSIDSPTPFFRTNLMGTLSVLNKSFIYWQRLRDAKKKNFRYVQISTDEVFGSLGPHDPKFSETSPLAPNSPYSATKAGADLLVRAWCHTYGFPTITTHCSNNYGPRQLSEKLIPHMILSALKGQPLPLYGNGTQIRDWIYVEDHCAGVLLALQKGIPGKTYCFGGHSEKTNLEVIQALCHQLDLKKPRPDGQSYLQQLSFVTDRPGHDQRYAIDDSLAQRELGFVRKFDFEQGLSQTVDWYLQNQANFVWAVPQAVLHGRESQNLAGEKKSRSKTQVLKGRQK